MSKGNGYTQPEPKTNTMPGVSPKKVYEGRYRPISGKGKGVGEVKVIPDSK